MKHLKFALMVSICGILAFVLIGAGAFFLQQVPTSQYTPWTWAYGFALMFAAFLTPIGILSVIDLRVRFIQYGDALDVAYENSST
jgi:hypothetical protein